MSGSKESDITVSSKSVALQKLDWLLGKFEDSEESKLRSFNFLGAFGNQF